MAKQFDTRKGSRGAAIEADLLEAARRLHLLRSTTVIWAVLPVAVALSVVSLWRHTASPPSPSATFVALLLAVLATTSLTSAGVLSLHLSRESRWDAPVTVGVGCILLGMGTIDHALAAAAATSATRHPVAIEHTLGVLRWSGIAVISGGLVWRADSAWSERSRKMWISTILVSPLATVSSWPAPTSTTTLVERSVLSGLALLLIATSLRTTRRDRTASLFDGGTFLGVGLALAIVIEAGSVAPGDVACIAALLWLILTAILTSLWTESQVVLRSKHQRARTERYIQLVEDNRAVLERAMSDRSVLRHNGRSSLVAIEGGLDALERSVEVGDLTMLDRMIRALNAEITRLGHMIDGETGTDRYVTRLADVLEPVAQLAELQGQEIDLDLTASAAVAAPGAIVAEIVHNLLDNAAQHAPGARVTITARPAHSGWIELVVTDDGPGIDDGVREHLFQRGVSRHPSPTNGLGLFSSRRLARQAGGELHLLPTMRGAGFALILPAASSQPRDTDAAGRIAQPNLAGGRVDRARAL